MKSSLRDAHGAVLIIELVVLAAVLAVAGFAEYQYTSHKKAANQAVKPNPHMAAKSSPSPSASTPPTQKPANEFDVPELGFKMTLPAGLNDLKYIAELNQTEWIGNSPLTVSTARFTTQYLGQAACSTDGHAIGIGHISKYNSDPRSLHLTDIGTVKSVGDFYLEESGSQAACGDSASVNAKQLQMMQLLSQAFDTASPL
jgi:hypothetical protein